MKKQFLLDTSIFIRNPKCLDVFDDNDVALCGAVLEELDNLKTTPGNTGYCAREAIRSIEHHISNGWTLKGGGKLLLVSHNGNGFPDGWDPHKADNIIVLTAKDTNSILITADISMRVKAQSIGVANEVFRNEEVSEETLMYTGRRELFVPGETIDNWYRITSTKSPFYYPIKDAYANEFILLKDQLNEKHTALAIYQNECLNPLQTSGQRPFGVYPRNIGQKFALEALLAPSSEIPLVILKGPAGTAKTFLSLAAGLHQVMETQTYRNVLIFRPNTKFDDDIGFLKGDEMDKIRPLIRPCLDNLAALLCDKSDNEEEAIGKVDYVFDKGYVKAEALAYLRGRSIANTYIVVDEAQNSTPNQMLGILTRAGIDSKIVISGDPDQIDNPKLDRKNNGLVYASEKMRGSSLCAQITFEETECVRSALAKEALRLTQ